MGYESKQPAGSNVDLTPINNELALLQNGINAAFATLDTIGFRRCQPSNEALIQYLELDCNVSDEFPAIFIIQLYLRSLKSDAQYPFTNSGCKVTIYGTHRGNGSVDLSDVKAFVSGEPLIFPANVDMQNNLVPCNHLKIGYGNNNTDGNLRLYIPIYFEYVEMTAFASVGMPQYPTGDGFPPFEPRVKNHIQIFEANQVDNATLASYNDVIFNTENVVQNTIIDTPINSYNDFSLINFNVDVSKKYNIFDFNTQVGNFFPYPNLGFSLTLTGTLVDEVYILVKNGTNKIIAIQPSPYANGTGLTLIFEMGGINIQAQPKQFLLIKLKKIDTYIVSTTEMKYNPMA